MSRPAAHGASEPVADPIALPNTPLARATVDLARDVETASLFNHSIRSYLFARLAARHLGLAEHRDYDDQLLFAACALHDLGLAADGRHDRRFEVEGADRTAEFLTEHGVPAADVDGVWQAIALHTSPGIAERRGTLCVLVREGIGLDFGGVLGAGLAEAVTDEQAQAIHAVYPRLAMVRSLVDAIVAQAAVNPANAPRYSVPGELLRERGIGSETRMEQAARSSRWGD